MASKEELLGMSTGTAVARLRKMVLFDLLQKHGENNCFRCELPIESIEDLTMEHIKKWRDDPTLYWDLTNVAFSHYRCNSREGGITQGSRNGQYWGKNKGRVV